MKNKKKVIRNKKARRLAKINLIACLVSLVLFLVNQYVIYRYNYFNFKGLNLIITAVSIVLLVGVLLLNLYLRTSRATLVAGILYIIVMLVLSYTLFSTLGLLNKLSRNVKENEYNLSLVVLNDSKYQTIDDIKTLKVAIPTNDEKNVDDFLKALAIKGIELDTVKVDSYVQNYDKLINGEVEVMLWNEAFEPFIAAKDIKYNDKIRKIYSMNIKQVVQNAKKYSDNNRIFNIYISGIDTAGPIDSISRSDVNIIATVNMNTHEILLTTTPRDSFVPIADDGYDNNDKLTHAGMYGALTSLHTLENLYDIEIPYYAKVNFTTFMNIINIIGDIEVYNDQDFHSLNGNNGYGYDFPIGQINMDADKTLAFVRERYALLEGDFDRGKNQQKVLKAIIEKLLTSDMLSNHQQLLKLIGEATQTNMSVENMMYIINDQLENNVSYKIETQDLKVVGGYDYSPLMGGQELYVGYVDDESLEEISSKIKAVIAGKKNLIDESISDSEDN